ncbi:MAG TPA: hypothetical protein VIT91_10145 [Chthoniobacterales bacterium]
MESSKHSSPEHLLPFSIRTTALVSGTIASAAALGLLFSGVFRGQDFAVIHWLGLGHAPRRFPIGVDAILVLLSGFGAAWIAFYVQPVLRRRFLLAITTLQPASAVAVAGLEGVYFSPFAVLIAIGLALVAAMIFRTSAPRIQLRRLQKAFDKHVSAATLEVLTKGSGIHQTGTTIVTALVCRFEGHGAGDLSEAASFFKNRGAWVEERPGNRLLALFNMPVPEETHVLTACSAALVFMQERPKCSIGLAVGMVTAGIAGTSSVYHVNGPVIDEVDIICRANSRLRTSVLATLKTFDAVSQDVVARPIDLMESAVTNERAEVYELLALAKSASQELLKRRDRFWEGVILSRRGENREAAACFRELGNDSVALSFLKRLEVEINESEAASAAN